MAVTAFWLAKALLAAFNKEIDFVSDGINLGLTTSAWTPNQDTMDYYTDVTNELGTANGYTAGGETLANKTLATTNNVLTGDNTADIVWTTGAGETLTARRAFLYDTQTGVAATEPLILWVDFGGDESASNGGTFTITPNASGLFTITAADAAGYP